MKKDVFQLIESELEREIGRNEDKARWIVHNTLEIGKLNERDLLEEIDKMKQLIQSNKELRKLISILSNHVSTENEFQSEVQKEKSEYSVDEIIDICRVCYD